VCGLPMCVHSIRSLLIADDLTGACDAAVHFRKGNTRPVVRLWAEMRHQDDAATVAYTTDTRDSTSKEEETRILRIASAVANQKFGLIFKKIDSLLRGNIARQVQVAVQAFGCEAAVIAPAYPVLGRTVRDGHVFVEGDEPWKPLHLAARLLEGGLAQCRHFAPSEAEAALARNDLYYSADTICQDDLHAIALAGLRSKRRILWAGSGGLAAALARALSSETDAPTSPVHSTLPMLFCIGSQHRASVDQINELRGKRDAVQLYAEECTPEELRQTLEGKRHVILRFGRMDPALVRIPSLLGAAADLYSALFLSGGDTASQICSASGAAKIELEAEVMPGVPWGISGGGLLEGSKIVTKSGAFGNAQTLITIADYFSCLTR
jgi:D-threonate/D-erythronate kinase